MRIRKHLSFIIVVAAFTCVALVLFLTIENENDRFGHISVYVIDAYSYKPLKNAAVVIPECENTVYTDARGVALLSSVPIDMDSDFIRLTGASYGEITMIIYAEGYLPCVWFKVHIYPSRIRSGPTIYMFPEGGEDVLVTVFTESPEDTLMRDFVARYAPSR